jgi:murein DD-endopeptidase MepM/ murein hydrolase activator NlpD
MERDKGTVSPAPLLRYNPIVTTSSIASILETHRDEIAPVVPFDLAGGGLVVFDFTDANRELAHLDINDVSGFTDYLFAQIAAAETPVGIGRYDEDRVLYRHSPLFDGVSERRSIHLGIDLFVIEGTEISTPLPARVHSAADNAGLGNYGPTVILRHELDGTRFHTLYGHLSRSSLGRLEPGNPLAPGDIVGEVGDLSVNGSWPPHLHFQVITGPLGDVVDYAGVAAPSERQRFLDLCPDPNLILGIPDL